MHKAQVSKKDVKVRHTKAQASQAKKHVKREATKDAMAYKVQRHVKNIRYIRCKTHVRCKVT